MINTEVLYENEHILVIDKPYGVIVNRAITHRESTVQDYAESYLNIRNSEEDELSDFRSRSGIVHRLDKDTSGVLMIAKTPDAFTALQKQFKQRKITKEYLAVVHGEILEETAEIDAPIGRNPKNRLKYAVVADGKEALTKLTKIGCFVVDGSTFSMIKVFPHTGRTHQIRVHLAAMGHPVAGDHLYSSRVQKEIAGKIFGRMMLHSRCISFIDPGSKIERQVCSPLPHEFQVNIC